MSLSDAILTRLTALHPKIIDLSLDRMWRILAALDHPERRLPPVIHVAGTNGKGSVVAFLRAMLEAAGKSVHVYTSPHLVHFHERIRLGAPGGGEFISDAALSALLEECEQRNGGEPITFFEITTAAAFLAFSRNPADYLILEVGLGGRLDATNVVDPLASVITMVDYDHQQFLGDTLTEIATEKAGIIKRGRPCILGVQGEEALAAIEHVASRLGAPLIVAGQEWQAFEQHGRLVYEDMQGLLDLPLPRLNGRFQIDNAGLAIATLRALDMPGVGEAEIARGLQSAYWPARLERLDAGPLNALLPAGAELWLDGGHNESAGRVLAASMAEIEERVSRPLLIIWGMLNTKDPGAFIRSFAGLARRVITLTIPGEPNAVDATVLATIAAEHGIESEIAASLPDALRRAGLPVSEVAPRVLICGSLYLAGHVLAAHESSLQSGGPA
ncbi:bifunctional folylpolyglutamate synthase/dihydrofolate synthase [Rhodoligotrophos defluvii]|uniref:bifunctional folylpolyglutamate synthase/dihydrofolate synthase n=1 Tax=Rhodoligotrophos defluvii TaxID=2561934 RepID=UPI0010C96F0F|nr:folylpolyglutamate synthase/dihydrofolate synthase family protein [Rhodoligotrophos defluvii]